MQESLKIFGTFIAGSAVGLLVGYKVAEKQLADRFDERLEKETAEMKVFYTDAKTKYKTPEEAVAALIPEPDHPQDPREKTQKVPYHKIIRAEEYAVSDEVEGAKAAEENGVVSRNVFDSRDTEKPYIISQDEFMQNDPGFEQATLTYYEQDGTLVDARDDIISDKKESIGDEFQDHFGTGSSDSNVVHIRNEKLSMDFEVLRSERSFAVDVLGESEAG